MMFTNSGLLCIILMFTGSVKVVIAQDCDSFVCLLEFHEGMKTTVRSTNTLCSISQAYLFCLRQSTEICTSLTIQEMTDVATLLMTHAECGSESAQAGFMFTMLTASIVTMLSL